MLYPKGLKSCWEPRCPTNLQYTKFLKIEFRNPTEKIYKNIYKNVIYTFTLILNLRFAY